MALYLRKGRIVTLYALKQGQKADRIKRQNPYKSIKGRDTLCDALHCLWVLTRNEPFLTKMNQKNI